MIWFVYDDGHFIGTVIAADRDDALVRATEKFGSTWGFREVKEKSK